MNNQEKTILVSGATGNQGGAVARHLLEQGFSVRALSRDKNKKAARALAESGAEVVEGNFDDRASLDRALKEADGAFSVQNTFIDGPEAEIRMGKAFAEAAKDAEIDHFVYSSVGAADRNTGIPHFESRWEIEECIRALDLPATILRPVAFMENWGMYRGALQDGTLPQPLSPDTPLQQIAVDDIGAFAALAFAHPDRWMGKAVEIAGDDVKMNETASIFSEVMGQPVEYVQVEWDDFEAQAGKDMTLMYRWFENEGYEADINALKNKYPALKDLRTFLQASHII